MTETNGLGQEAKAILLERHKALIRQLKLLEQQICALEYVIDAMLADEARAVREAVAQCLHEQLVEAVIRPDGQVGYQLTASGKKVISRD